MQAFSFADSRRIVVKVGSSLLVQDDGAVNRSWLAGFVADIALLHGEDKELLIVSSGAVAIGCGILGINKKRARLPDLQAAAAAGQIELVHAYQEALATHGVRAAQILLTPGDTEDRRRFLNARATLSRLLERSVIPIINENDTVATEEIRYGDNDRLAARVSQLVMADCLLLLSDVDGLYDADPVRDASARHVPEVRNITDDIVRSAGETKSDVGTGGMATKVQAAQIATRAGCTTVVASGTIERPLSALQKGARSTVFRATATPAAARKQWLAGALEVRGEMQVDDGARDALQKGNSLLPVGVRSVSGEFSRGDVVAIRALDGAELGRGLAEYAGNEARSICGCRSDEIEARIGYRGRSVMIHRDELVLFRHDG